MKPVTLTLFLSLFVVAIVVAAGLISTDPGTPSKNWETRQLSPHFWAEGAAIADINQNGHADVISGPFWFAGPDFTEKTAIYEPSESFKIKNQDGTIEKIPGFEGALGTNNKYSNNFLSFTYDFNQDGYPDYLVVGWPGKETVWYENPGEKGGLWTRHLALASTDNESPMFIDLTGNQIPDLLCMSGGQIGYASFDPQNPTAEWSWNPISPKNKAYQRYSHGLGHGDINGDGLQDILSAEGWWQQPADWDGKSPWTLHPIKLGKGGAQMFGYDVNQNGRTDIITSLEAHGFGLAWFEQNEDASWTRHLLTDTPTEKGSTGVAFSQPHALTLVDIDGDGLLDIVTGKRFWAHGPTGDPESDQPAVVYVFLLKNDENTTKFEPVLVHADSGVGCQFPAGDLNQNGKPDLVTANKKGLFIHLQR